MANVTRVDYGKYAGVKRVDTRRKREPLLSKGKIYAIIALIIFVFIGFRMATMEANLELTTTFTVPKGVSLSGVGADVTGVKWAAAIDGQVIVGNDEKKVQPTASTTKMILSLMIMEKKPFKLGEKGETIEITEEMYDKYGWYLTHDGSNSQVKIGEKISEYDALVSTMLVSSNNMADSLAIWAFGSIDEYQKYTNKTLKDWGFENTTIGTKDASGYDEGTTSTASDLARIGYRVMLNPVLAEIVGLETAEVPVAGELTNTNKLLGKAGIVGVKTGYIGDPSGYCIVSAYKAGNHIYTVSLLGSNTRSDSFDENLAIVKDLQKQLVEIDMINRGDEVGYYDSWWTNKVTLKASESFSEVNFDGAENDAKIIEDELIVKIGESEYGVSLEVPEFSRKPSLIQRFLHVFGWKK
jgi:D-alanyl-D-alanine carboxypeptidase (penicillin-binding protein 5/6)